MSRSHFVVVEAALVFAGLALMALLFGLPSCGGDAGSGAAAVPSGPPMVDVKVIGSVGEAEGTAGGDCTAPMEPDFLSANQIVSFYGNPYTADLGILGALPPDEMIERLRRQASAYDKANGVKGVQPALHLVSTTAQGDPGKEGEYVLHVDNEILREWVELACDEGLTIFLDIQRGQADLFDEIDRIRPFLELPHVHLALDPEFAMAAGEVPGQTIGGYTAEEINSVQEYLQDLVESEGLPDKMLIVHQFEVNMIGRPWDVRSYPNVAVVVDMDGFGDPATKERQFKSYAQPSEYSGIKLFYGVDQPLMTEEEVARLRPNVVIYQ